jgi:hypothetical protein
MSILLPLLLSRWQRTEETEEEPRINEVTIGDEGKVAGEAAAEEQ